jgi:hypothetical protein
MGSVVHPKFLGSYLRLAHEYGVPAFLPRITRDRLQTLGEGDMADAYLDVLAMVDADQVPTLDDIIIETLVPKTSKHDFYRDLIAGIRPGLTHLLFHPAVAGPELEAIAHTHASRHADYEAFSDRSLRDFAEGLGIHLVGYRALKAHLKI